MAYIQNSKYDDPELYSLVSEHKSYDMGYIIHQQILKENENGNLIKRTLKYSSPGLTKTQIDTILERNKWERFGKGKDDLNNRYSAKNEDHVFMEYNPEILKSKKSKNAIKKMLTDPYNIDKIKVTDDNQLILDNIISSIYNGLKNDKNISRDVLDYNYKYITDYKHVNNWAEKKNVNTEEEIKKKLPKKTGAFVPSFMRNRGLDTGGTGSGSGSGSDSGSGSGADSNKFIPRHRRGNNNSNDSDNNKSIRLYNLPEPIEYDELRNWLNTFELGRHKLFLPKNKRTNENQNFCFLNFFCDDDVQNGIDILNKQKFEYNIVKAEISIRKN